MKSVHENKPLAKLTLNPAVFNMKMKGYLSFFVLLVILEVTRAASIVSGITACKISDEECMKKSGTAALQMLKAGDKSLGLNKFDSIQIKRVFAPGNGGQVDLEQEFTDITFTGMGSAEITKMKVDLSDDKCHIDLETVNKEETLFAGKYKLTGKLLIFTLKGSGDAKVKFDDLKIVWALKCEKYKKDGKEYLKITDGKFDLDPKKVTYVFPNVVPGDEKLSEEINKVANENDLEIFNEIKAAYGAVFGKIFMEDANQFLSKVQIKDVFLM